jgi:hypothetical protein
MGMASKDMGWMTQVKERYENDLLRIDGVIGVGIGLSESTSEPCIKIFVKEKSPRVQVLLPKRTNGGLC